jgi:hypothetical protein
MKEFLKHILTGIDNKTYDLVRVIGFAVGLQFLFLAQYAVMKNKQPFAAVEYGTGAGLVIAAIGASLKLKSDTEPKPEGHT